MVQDEMPFESSACILNESWSQFNYTLCAFFFREVFVYQQRGNDVNFSNHLKLEGILQWQIEAFKLFLTFLEMTTYAA